MENRTCTKLDKGQRWCHAWFKDQQGNGYIVEPPLQLICDLEIGGEISQWQPNPGAKLFVPRVCPEGGAKTIARVGIKNVLMQKEDEDELNEVS